MTRDEAQDIEEVLALSRRSIKGIPFGKIIHDLYGHEVIKFDLKDQNNQRILEVIKKAMQAVCCTVQEKPIERSSPQGVGNAMEPFVINALIDHGLVARSPLTQSGRGKSTGYPDVKIALDGVPIYLEVKTYAAKNHDTTQRSFYLSPSDDPKITDNAVHLLVGFEIVKEGDLFHPVAFEIVDLYGLPCDWKSEFNADNKRLYEDSRTLVKFSTT